MIILKADDVIPPVAPLACDILLRPSELEEMNMWDIMCLYEKCSKRRKNMSCEDSVETANEDGKLPDLIFDNDGLNMSVRFDAEFPAITSAVHYTCYETTIQPTRTCPYGTCRSSSRLRGLR